MFLKKVDNVPRWEKKPTWEVKQLVPIFLDYLVPEIGK
jgi:hypothetical protein